MNTTHMLATAAFTALTALTPFAAQAGDAPARTYSTNASSIYPDAAKNSYTQILVTNPSGTKVHARRVFDCTYGIIRNEMVVSDQIAQSGNPFVQATAEISVRELTPKAQETVRRNCSSNGLRAEF